MPTIQCVQNKVSRPVDQQSLYGHRQAGNDKHVKYEEITYAHICVTFWEYVPQKCF